jgi:arylsulfatase A
MHCLILRRLSLVLALLVLLLGPAGGLVSAEKPNIVFVLFDDLGYGEPTCYRSDSPFMTPNLDRLAKEGMRFTDAHSAASVCTPTRYGVLTGRYPSRIGQFGVLTTFSPPIIPASRLTVAGLLRQHGYHTGCVGKWHLGVTWDGMPGTQNSVPVGTPFRDGPTAIGFDSFCGFTHARNIGTILEQEGVIANVKAVETQPLLAQKAVEYIDGRAAAGGPFFLYLPLCTPHSPHVPAPEFVGKGGATGGEAQVAYADWLTQGDWVLGQVLDALDRHKLAGNTLVIATSDNGAAGLVYPPLRDCKTSIYEGGHRVPYLARWPGVVPAGSTCGQTVCLNDLLATSAAIVGATLPDDAAEDSVSLLPLLKGDVSTPVREATLHQSPAGDLALRQGAWKLIFFNDGRRELYQLDDDLGETRNQAESQPEVVSRLTETARQLIANGRSTPGEARTNEFAISLDASPRPGRAKKAQTPRE